MKELFEKAGLMVLGFFSGGTYSVIAQEGNKLAEPLVQQITAPTTPTAWDIFLKFFLAGLYGALGGLAIKILWCITKRIFPKLKKIDSTNET